MNCACGLPLHYPNEETRLAVQRMIDLAGGDQYVTVTEFQMPPLPFHKGRSWRVQRHYIALHGLKAQELPAIAAELGFEEVRDV